MLLTKTKFVATVLLNCKSARGMFVETADAELFCNAKSATAEATLAVFVKVPLLVATAVMIMVAVAVLSMLSRAQVTIPFVSEQVP